MCRALAQNERTVFLEGIWFTKVHFQRDDDDAADAIAELLRVNKSITELILLFACRFESGDMLADLLLWKPFSRTE